MLSKYALNQSCTVTLNKTQSEQKHVFPRGNHALPAT